MRRGLFHGWVIVLGAFLVLFMSYGTQYAFGVFFSALLAEFGWSRASLSGAFALYAFAYPLFGFPAGRMTDRWGPRVVIALGGLFLGGALAGMSLVTRLWHPYVLYGAIAAVGMGTAYVPCTTTVVRWFSRQRGLAMGLASSGGSVGTFLLPLVAQLLVSAVGWRRAYIVFGAGIFLALSLVARIMRRDPESLGLHPDGDPCPPSLEPAGEDGWSLGDAVRTPTFWILAAAYSATWTPVFIPLVHIVPFSRDHGFSPLAAASVVSVLGVGAILGRVVMGGVSDRIGRKPAVAACMALQALAFLAFIVAGALPLLYTNALVFGYSYGGISALFPAVVGDLFGRAQAGSLVGVLFAISASMGGWGPLAAGAIYDRRGSYDLAFALSAALNVAALVLVAVCPRVRRPTLG